MGNELITEHDERIRSYFQALERLSKALETLFSKRKSSLDGESFYTDEELSQRLKISRRSLQDYRNQGRIPYIKLGGKILYRSSDIERMLEEGYRNEFRTRGRNLTTSAFIVFLLFIGSISKNGPERIRQPFSRGASPSAEAPAGKIPRGVRLAFRSGPLPCCRMKRSVMCHLSGIIGMIKYKFIPVRV